MPHSWLTSACRSFNSASVSAGVSLVFMWIRFLRLLPGRGGLFSCSCSSPRSSPRLATPGRSRFFCRRLVSNLARRQYLADIEQNDQPSVVLAQPRHTVQSACLHHGGRGFDFAFGNFQDLRRRVHNHARQPAPVFHNQNAAAPVESGGRLPEPLPQIHHRDNLPPHVDHPFQIIGRVRHRRDLRHADDLMQRCDGHAVGLATHPEAHNMCFSSNRWNSLNEIPPPRAGLRSRTPACCRSTAAQNGPSNPAGPAPSSTSDRRKRPVRWNPTWTTAPVHACAPWPAPPLAPRKPVLPPPS